MDHYYWNDWYLGWGWLLWYGLIIMMFSSFGNWGYTYRVHRRLGNSQKNSLDILNERYARGEIKQDEYLKMKTHIAETVASVATPIRNGRSGTNLSSKEI